jgi:hypothetical protein
MSLHMYESDISLAFNAKIYVSEEIFNFRKFKTMRPNESYRLVTTVLVLNSHCGKIFFVGRNICKFIYSSDEVDSDQLMIL